MNTLFTLTARTPLNTIMGVVRSDFDVEIDSSDAKLIRDAYQKGCLVWTTQHLKTTFGARRNLNITRGHAS